MGTENNLPGVPAGSPPASPVEPSNPPIPPSGNGGGVSGQPKPLFGGNVGKRVRADGLKAGSPEAKEADRRRDAERKRSERIAKRAALPPPPLPSAGEVKPGASTTAPKVPEVPLPGEAMAGPAFGDSLVEAVDWVAADFDGAAPEVIDLFEAWIIESNTALATEGGLPEKVVRKIAADSAFPRGSKDSLRRTSPALLAKFANSVSLPVSLKPYIAGLPSVAVIVLGQFKLRGEIRRLIEADKNAKTSAGPSQQVSTTPHSTT